MSQRITNHHLVDVSEDWDMIELDDGSQWSVMPKDTSNVVTWIPQQTITLELVDSDSDWPYELINLDVDMSVRAKMEHKPRNMKQYLRDSH
jgi:hypothetical protein